MTREEAKDLLLNISAYDIDMQRGMAKQEAIDMAIKALEQEPCADAISRQAVLDLIADYDLSMGQVVRGIHALPPVSMENPNRCGDAISRQAALDAMATWDWQELYLPIHFKQLLEDLPSVSTEKTGRLEWNQYDYNPNLGNWHCSECRSIVIECVPKKDPSGVPLYKYCPNCGCRMMEVEE